MPERDIESLGVMGWGLEAATKFFHRRRRRRPLGALGPWAQWTLCAWGPKFHKFRSPRCLRFRVFHHLRWVRIHPSHQVSMDEPRESSN